MTSRLRNEYGEIIISDGVIAQIASQSVMGSYGIVGLAFRNATDGILTLLRKENISKGVKVESTEGGIIIHLDVVLEYGVRIAVVTENIIEIVRYNVETLTGIPVVHINVYVQGIRV